MPNSQSIHSVISERKRGDGGHLISRKKQNNMHLNAWRDGHFGQLWSYQ